MDALEFCIVPCDHMMNGSSNSDLTSWYPAMVCTFDKGVCCGAVVVSRCLHKANMELFMLSILCLVTIVKATGLAAVIAFLNTS